ncbi:thiamine pyrophosphate-binding protein [Vulcanisaeta souniana]|uniref:thiamine pyrophosphate-binding protein n=1 Tax=Vulcanisaeta souniana TaxID=164452 RepID=UPI000AB9745E|nr:thiamine pyrophosphate-binding protein [Vulcanisaeta souniana]
MKVYEAITDWFTNVNKYVFTVAAENILSLLRSLIDRGGGFVVNSRFEPSAGFMALVSSRLLLRPGLLVLTAGPGVFGALSPIAEAFVEGDPLIIIAPSVVGGKGTHMHQLRDDTQFNTLGNVVKASFRLNGVGGISETLIKLIGLRLVVSPVRSILRCLWIYSTQRLRFPPRSMLAALVLRSR